MFDVRKFLALGRRDKVMVLRMIGAHFDPRASPSFTPEWQRLTRVPMNSKAVLGTMFYIFRNRCISGLGKGELDPVGWHSNRRWRQEILNSEFVVSLS